MLPCRPATSISTTDLHAGRDVRLRVGRALASCALLCERWQKAKLDFRGRDGQSLRCYEITSAVPRSSIFHHGVSSRDCSLLLVVSPPFFSRALSVVSKMLDRPRRASPQWPHRNAAAHDFRRAIRAQQCASRASDISTVFSTPRQYLARSLRFWLQHVAGGQPRPTAWLEISRRSFVLCAVRSP